MRPALRAPSGWPRPRDPHEATLFGLRETLNILFVSTFEEVLGYHHRIHVVKCQEDPEDITPYDFCRITTLEQNV